MSISVEDFMKLSEGDCVKVSGCVCGCTYDPYANNFRRFIGQECVVERGPVKNRDGRYFITICGDPGEEWFLEEIDYILPHGCNFESCSQDDFNSLFR